MICVAESFGFKLRLPHWSLTLSRARPLESSRDGDTKPGTTTQGMQLVRPIFMWQGSMPEAAFSAALLWIVGGVAAIFVVYLLVDGFRNQCRARRYKALRGITKDIR